MAEMTGRYRLRLLTRWRKPPLLVLQAQWKWVGPTPSDARVMHRSRWDDARIEDLSPTMLKDMFPSIGKERAQ